MLFGAYLGHFGSHIAHANAYANPNLELVRGTSSRDASEII